MPTLSRLISKPGPRFYEAEGQLMFVNQLDSSTRDGPREATQADAEAHPQAYAEMDSDPGVGSPPVTFSNPAEKPPEPEKPYARRRNAAAEA